MTVDFAGLLPPLTDEQYETLKASIAANGVVDPVLIWEATGEVFDGFHRVRCCEELGVDAYPRKVMSFASEDAVIAFIYQKHFGRRSMTGAAAAQYRDWRSNTIKQMHAKGSPVEAIMQFVGCGQTTVYEALGGLRDSASEKKQARDDEIRGRAHAGESQARLADAFDLSESTVSRIVNAPPEFTPQFDGDIDTNGLCTCPQCGETHRDWEHDWKMSMYVCGVCKSVFYEDDSRLDFFCREEEEEEDDESEVDAAALPALPAPTRPFMAKPPAMVVGDLPALPPYPTAPIEVAVYRNLMLMMQSTLRYEPQTLVDAPRDAAMRRGDIALAIQFQEWLSRFVVEITERGTQPQLRRVQ
jgi:hypothetical protein